MSKNKLLVLACLLQNPPVSEEVQGNMLRTFTSKV